MTSDQMTTTRDGFWWTTSESIHGLKTNAVVSSRVTKTHYDVVVIGAGFAGLTAARDITAHSDKNVLVLEARDRIGGRTWTSRAFDMDFEMGGTWVHWFQPHVWAELHRYGLHQHLKSSASPTTVVVGPSKDQAPKKANLEESFAKVEAVMADFFNIDGYTARTLMPYPHDAFREPAPWAAYDHLSVRDRLDQIAGHGKFAQSDLDLLEVVACGVSLAPAEQTGFVEFLRWIALSGYTLQGMSDTTGTYKIGNGGMTGLGLRIFGDYRGDIMFNAAVQAITQDMSAGEKVVVTLSDGRSFSARDVISTIPLNVLSSIRFSPELPKLQQEAISIGHAGRGYKIHHKISPSAAPFIFMASPRAMAPYNTGTSDNLDADGNDSSHFVAFGLSGRTADVEDHQKIVSACHQTLDDNQDRTVEGYLCHDWTGDPYARGTWCAYAPGYSVKYQRELQKSHGSVHFASADWADGWKGFVDGAIAQGKLSASKILASAGR